MFQNFDSKFKQMSNFHPLEVVGRGSETQLQEGGNLNWISYQVKE